MTLNEIFPEEVLKDRLIEQFPADYFEKWERKFGHSFISAHMNRTFEYDKEFIAPELAGHSVLEVGGYPGLLVADYLFRGCKVTAIDSPHYRPEEYVRFAEAKFFYSIQHDINLGAPPLASESRFDFCVMSDVLLHNESFPSEFIAWALDHCNKFYMLNYPEQVGTIRHAAQGHSLHAGYELPKKEAIIEEMALLGAKITSERLVGGRDLLVFEKKKKRGRPAKTA
jgi:hypothetical protein